MAIVEQHFHNGPDKEVAERLCRMEQMLGTIISNQESFRMSYEEDVARANAAREAINSHLDGIKADVTTLMEKVAAIPQAGMTPEQAAAMKDIADGLESLAAKAGALDDMNA